jgi:hypothetical protein
VDLSRIPILALTEELRIGSVEGPPETQFHQVGRPVLDSQRRIYVPLQQAGEIRQFDDQGKYLRTIGRAGAGPGEFQFVNSVFVLGDTIVAVDGRSRRLTMFTTEGALVGTARMPDANPGSVTPGGGFQNGWFFNVPQPWDFPPNGTSNERLIQVVSVTGTRDPIQAMEHQTAGGSVAVASVSQGKTFGLTIGGVLTGQKPLWDQRLQGWGIDERGRVYVAARGEYRIDVFDASGRLLSRIRRTHAPVPITQELEDRLTKQVVAYYDSVPTRGEFGESPLDTYRFRADIPTAPSLSPLGDLRVGRDGSFMVERPDLVEDPVAVEWPDLGPQASHWDLFEADGTFKGTMTFPPGARPNVLSDGTVLCVVQDELGVEYVVRYRIG